MSLPMVKICDVRTMEALRICKECNADLIGMHLINPPIRPDLIAAYKEIVANAENLKTVLLSRNIPIEDLVSILTLIPFDYIQIHRPCSIEEVLLLKDSVLQMTGRQLGVITVFEARNCDYSHVIEMSHYADFILFDSHYLGGTGLRITVDDLKAIASNCQGINYFIAGGLKPDNVEEVLRVAHPYGVDVQTGVECEKHVKDYNKVKEFVNIVRSFEKN